MAVQMDTINQISLICRRRDDVPQRLRRVLRQISELPAYRKWYEKELFYSGQHFRVPSDFRPEHDEDWRLLEQMDLVDDDVLRVQVNTPPGDEIFLTDGLFVPAEFRVFPFLDESNLIKAHYEKLGWEKWASGVIDPAVGCGHNVLRYRGDGAVRRVGFDVSGRALGYATLNTQLRAPRTDATKPTTVFALNDIRDGLPPMILGERVLALVNMPFAIEPKPEMIVRTAAGGERGYELTLSALRALDDFARALRDETEVRAVVLAYSLGNAADDSWVVAEEARQLFGSSRVRWETLVDEKLWRVNGRKEQPNPMPVESLRLKAECRFYVRNPQHREEVREEYARMERIFRREGLTHLAYGVLDIRLSR